MEYRMRSKLNLRDKRVCIRFDLRNKPFTEDDMILCCQDSTELVVRKICTDQESNLQSEDRSATLNPTGLADAIC